MNESEYRAIPALSATSAKWLLRSPAHYKHRMENRVESVTFDVGHAVHAKILGVGAGVVAYPDEHLTPSGNVSSKAATKEWAEEQRTAGLTPISPDQMAAMGAMAEAVLTHPVAGPLLELPGETEVPLIAECPTTGVPIKGRIDRLARDGDRLIPVDLKTTPDASPEAFTQHIAKFGYDIQGAMYRRLIQILRGVEAEPFRIIAVEKEEPHAVAVHDIDGWYAEIGDRRLDRAIARYAEAIKSNHWPAYPAVVHTPDPPAWLAYQEDEPELELSL